MDFSLPPETIDCVTARANSSPTKGDPLEPGRASSAPGPSEELRRELGSRARHGRPADAARVTRTAGWA